MDTADKEYAWPNCSLRARQPPAQATGEFRSTCTFGKCAPGGLPRAVRIPPERYRYPLFYSGLHHQ